MEPFIISEDSSILNNINYPSIDIIKKLNFSLKPYEKSMFLHLYFTEGIPYAFKDNPLLYEKIRNWLAYNLNIDDKQITIIGSARIGYSLSPDKIAKKFCDQSDLDFLIVSSDIFKKLVKDFEKWVNNFKLEIQKRNTINEYQAKLLQNIETLDSSIPRGFIDIKMIPNIKNNSFISLYNNLMWQVIERLKITNNAPRPKKASIRVYSSWKNCLLQMTKNLNYLFIQLEDNDKK